jgi:hypothetical protein
MALVSVRVRASPPPGPRRRGESNDHQAAGPPQLLCLVSACAAWGTSRALRRVSPAPRTAIDFIRQPAVPVEKNSELGFHYNTRAIKSGQLHFRLTFAADGPKRLWCRRWRRHAHAHARAAAHAHDPRVPTRFSAEIARGAAAPRAPELAEQQLSAGASGTGGWYQIRDSPCTQLHVYIQCGAMHTHLPRVIKHPDRP